MSCCSFCSQDETQVRKLIAGTPEKTGVAAWICDQCLVLVQSSWATVAYCSECHTDSGKHAAGCGLETA